MNESKHLPCPAARCLIGGAGTGLRKISTWAFFILLAICIRVDISLAAPGDFDGNYKGKITLNPGAGNTGCVDSNMEQVMLVSGGQVYLDRKSPYSGIPLLLSGSVGEDGTISDSGVTQIAGGL